MKLYGLLVLLLSLCFQFAPVAAVDWREDAVRYATGGEAQGLIQGESFIMYTIMFCFVNCLLSIFDIVFQYIKIVCNVEPRLQVL